MKNDDGDCEESCEQTTLCVFPFPLSLPSFPSLPFASFLSFLFLSFHSSHPAQRFTAKSGSLRTKFPTSAHSHPLYSFISLFSHFPLPREIFPSVKKVRLVIASHYLLTLEKCTYSRENHAYIFFCCCPSEHSLSINTSFPSLIHSRNTE